MNISQAAKLSGLSVKTVRYYADIKMVEPARDIQSGYRSYSNDDVSKLNFNVCDQQLKQDYNRQKSYFESSSSIGHDGRSSPLQQLTR